MSRLLFKNINKIYPGGQQAIKDFNLEIKDHELLVLSGPDGCGKSTLLRMIAGLEEITSGSLYMDGVDVTNAEPRERSVAMIFRNSVLYPHMTVRENLTFALRMAKVGQDEIEKRVKETAAELNLSPILDKLPEELTTYQTYQTLLGRALMRRPKVLLMDSTIADLDEEIQEVIRQKFLNIHEKMDMTVIYVTENQKSAMTLGSRMIVMSDGEICQDDTPENLFTHPKTSYVAGVVGYPPMNFFVASVYEQNGEVGLSFKKGKVLLPAEKGSVLLERAYLKKEVLIGMRADALSVVSGKKKGGEGELTCKIQGMEQLYSRPMLRFIMEETSGLCMTEEMPAGGEGSTVVLALDADKIQIFDRETDCTIVY
ncbi:MAG: ABC transporter ATP-binding protein [Lachnoclostridium sp.]|nr:ABC transporter ATP-binding protein [Lachnoclostridium sp.]